MNVHLEVYIVNETGQRTNVWRRTLHQFEGVPTAMQFMLYNRERSQKWLFPSMGSSSGDHYDTHLEAYVIWIQMSQNVDLTDWGFNQLIQERWT